MTIFANIKIYVLYLYKYLIIYNINLCVIMTYVLYITYVKVSQSCLTL